VVAALALWGCAHVSIRELSTSGALEVHLDANVRAYHIGTQAKFFVDIYNRSPQAVELGGLQIELQASPVTDPDSIQMREDWSYRWPTQMLLEPGRKITVPIVPEKRVEFTLEVLRPGPYRLAAVVNQRYRSEPYALNIVRPELTEQRRIPWPRNRIFRPGSTQ